MSLRQFTLRFRSLQWPNTYRSLHATCCLPNESTCTLSTGLPLQLCLSLTNMLLPVHILLCALALTICPVPISVAANLQQSVKSFTPYPQKPASETRHEPSRARLFTSTAIGLLSLPKDPFRDNMTAGIESLLTPALLREVRDFWFQHLDNADSFVIADQEAGKRWYMGGQAFDQTCV